MSQTTHFSSDGITILNVYREIIHMDYFGQGVVVQVQPQPEEPNPRGEFRRLRRTLLDNIDRAITKEYDEPNIDEIRRGKQRIKQYLSPLLAGAVPARRSPLSRPDPVGHRHSVAWSIYDGVTVLALRQTRGGRPFLETLRRRMDPPANIPEDTTSIYPDLISVWTDELTIISDFLTINAIQGTVTLPNNRRFTCLAFRDIGIAGRQRSSLFPMLSTLGAANQIRASILASRACSSLCVPRLHGYVYHRMTRWSECFVQLVSGLVDHMRGACSWAVLRGERWPGAERQKEWSTQLLNTLTLLHENGLVWGGAVGCAGGYMSDRLMESVDIDDSQRPWLVRNYGGRGVSREAAVESDRAAVEELRLILGVYGLDAQTA